MKSYTIKGSQIESINQSQAINVNRNMSGSSFLICFFLIESLVCFLFPSHNFNRSSFVLFCKILSWWCSHRFRMGEWPQWGW